MSEKPRSRANVSNNFARASTKKAQQFEANAQCKESSASVTFSSSNDSNSPLSADYI